MNDLSPYNSQLPALQQQHAQAFNTVSRSLGKVKIKLTDQQFRSLVQVVALNVARTRETKGLFLLADLRELYLLSEKLKRRMLSHKSEFTLSLNMTEAAALYMCLDNTEFAEFAIYESNLSLFIIQEIDKQTV
ncbi:MAG: hypothetical protein V1775_18295 [Bacteroidota bacterium]